MPVDITENTIRVRVRDPGDFQKESFRTITISASDGIQAVIGRLKGETSTTVQTYLFDKKKWTEEKAVNWVEEHKGKKTFEDVSQPSVKAVGDWELDVLAVPYGGPDRGRDRQGEFFNKDTNLYLDQFDKPLVTYYHGFDPQGYPQGEPEVIGEVLSMEKKSDGLWVRVLLDKASQYAQRVWEAAKEGLARASSGTIEHIRRVARNGLITHWPFAELALLDKEGDRKPANAYAVALPVMKAAYKQAGKDWPELPEDETDLTLVQLKGRAFLIDEE